MMDLNSFYVADIETTGLLPELKRGDPTQLHVLGVFYKEGGSWKVKTTNKETDVKKLFEDPNNTIVGHNFYMYDLPALEKIYPDINIQATIVDSLWISWYIEPNRLTHGLEGYGEDFGIKKPEISSWTDLSYEEYEHRVTEDVKINTSLFLQQLSKLRELYDNDEERIISLINFLMCKAKQYKMHQNNPLRIDLPKAEEYKEEIEGLIEERCNILSKVMPKVKVISEKHKPKNLFKKDGTLSVAGEKWGKLTEHYGKDITFEGPLEYVSKIKDPNPRSNIQVKDWLFSLGWEPDFYKESVLKSGEIKKVPQIKDNDGELCKSVLKLAEKEPAIKELEDMGVLGHRLGIVKGFIRNSDDEGDIVADVGGTTNCVTADTVITTNRGALPICEITKDDQVLTHKGVWKRVTDFINNGVHTVYRITTSKGKSIKCTGRHRFYLGNERWIFAEGIKRGQEVYGYGDREIWKPVGDNQTPNFISSWGRYTTIKGKPSYYRKRMHKDVREFCSYTVNGESFDVQRSRLIMEKFEGFSNLHVLHKDGKSCNNNIKNLYYGTNKQNHKDTQIHGTLVNAHRNRINSKLTYSDVCDIKERIKKGETNVSIAKFYEVSTSLISQIKTDKRWSDEKNVDNRYIESFEKEAVVSVERLDPEPVFDISVEDDHSYVANGLVTHNTLRIKHRKLVNMPKPNLKYGHYARSLVIPQPGKRLIGADLSSLENMTRNNFIYPYDPDYVNSMFVPYYDSHLPIGVTSGLITEVESHFYKWWKEKRKNPDVKPEDIGELPDKYYETVSAYRTDESKEDWSEDIDKRRGKAKTVSYSALYGVGVTKLSKELEVKKSVAKKLLDAYWKINWSVKKFASSCKIKHIGKDMWVLNPLNGFWYSLRNEKDIFSTVNQSAGDYIFTLWNYFNMKSGIILQAGFHDEIATSEIEKRCKEVVDKLQSNIDKVNKLLKLKLPIGIDYKIGDRYSEVH